MPQGPFRLNCVADSAVGVGAVTPITGTAYTLTSADPGRYLQTTNGSAVAITVPPDSDLALPIGAMVTVEQKGAGQFTWTAGAGVTLNSASAKVASAAQFAVSSAVKVAANTWTLMGNLA